ASLPRAAHSTIRARGRLVAAGADGISAELVGDGAVPEAPWLGSGGCPRVGDARDLGVGRHEASDRMAGDAPRRQDSWALVRCRRARGSPDPPSTRPADPP